MPHVDAPKVLYVEDDDDSRELLLCCLRHEGLNACGARTVAEGIEALRSERYDLIIADYNLPDGTGTEMVRRARQQGLLGSASVFLCTALEYPEYDDGMGLFHKPVNLRSFVRAVHSALPG